MIFNGVSAAPERSLTARLKQPDQIRHACRVLIHLRHQRPLFAPARPKHHPRVDEIRTAAPADQRFLIHRLPAPEAIELRRAQQPARRFEALRPDRSRAQRLVRLGPVGWNGAELEETQTGFGVEFVFLVAIRQRAVFHLEPAREAVRQEVLDAVQ